MGLFVGIFLLAMFGAALTVGLRTGSLAPYYPTVTRSGTPGKYWVTMAACAAIIALNIFNLIWKGLLGAE